MTLQLWFDTLFFVITNSVLEADRLSEIFFSVNRAIKGLVSAGGRMNYFVAKKLTNNNFDYTSKFDGKAQG